MPLDPQAARRLAGLTGRRYWRGLEELLAGEELREHLRREFPQDAEHWTDPVTRRQFLTLMGASLALAGINGCSTQPAPREKILPYNVQPEELLPGKPLYFATAMPLGGDAIGILAETHEGRPTKLEGNPDHPASGGSTDVFSQASVLGLYDPDRSQAVTFRGQPRAWDEAVVALRAAGQRLRERRGAGLRILTGAFTSPSLHALLRELLGDGRFPEARWVRHEPCGPDAAREGARIAFGDEAELNTYYDLREARVILALDSDFLHCGPAGVRYTRQFSDNRRVRTYDRPLSRATMARLYAVEAMLTGTGAMADHRLPLQAGQVEDFASALAGELGVAGAPEPGGLPDHARKWLVPLANDLRANRGHCAVIAGDGQPGRVHALALAINDALGNLGRTVLHTEPVEALPPRDKTTTLAGLAEDMRAGRVETLVILGTNPVYTAPVDVAFAAALAAMKGGRFHLGLYQDETAVQCDWHIPEAHYLESWGDCRCFDGTATILQPLIEPLYHGRTAAEVLAALDSGPDRLPREVVRDYWGQEWRRRGESGDFESFWQQAVQRGVVPGTQLPRRDGRMRPGWAGRSRRPLRALTNGPVKEVVFRPDPTLYDGRFANNGWLQELPKPVTKLTWDNAAIMSPVTARALGIAMPRPGDNGGERGQAIVGMVQLRRPRHKPVLAPAWVLPGHADGSVTVYLGHGRTRAGQVGNNTGFDAYPLRTQNEPWITAGATIAVVKAEGTHTLACTQMQFAMEGRRPVRGGTLHEYQTEKNFAARVTGSEEPAPPEGQEHDRRLVPLNLYTAAEQEFPYKGHKWGMAIDLTACTGCSACVVACQAENNIPVVGKDQVTRGREMHWLRIDRYFSGDPDDAGDLQTHFQPVPCMHCENAPCEVVCPVNATVHSHDGLNDMVYNRCVGTRYCSNNCPYKVRRFNFLQYSDFHTPTLKMQRNPEVTVRSRGVMEKCTYCVQRIRNAEIEEEKRLVGPLAALTERKQRGEITAEEAAREESRLRHEHRITDRDLMTACQAACPAGAIVFGDLNDKASAVRRWQDEPLDYGLLAELHTRPRTTYLAQLRNPNPEMPRP
jgi:molybdopterin-containing oxidoreductase family iron-sulfur binding subunit